MLEYTVKTIKLSCQKTNLERGMLNVFILGNAHIIARMLLFIGVGSNPHGAVLSITGILGACGVLPEHPTLYRPTSAKIWHGSIGSTLVMSCINKRHAVYYVPVHVHDIAIGKHIVRKNPQSSVNYQQLRLLIEQSGQPRISTNALLLDIWACPMRPR